MMIKSWNFFWWGVQEGKNTDFGGILRFKPLFCQPAPTKLAENVCLGVLQQPTKFQAKILKGKFICEKDQNIL